MEGRPGGKGGYGVFVRQRHATHYVTILWGVASSAQVWWWYVGKEGVTSTHTSSQLLVTGRDSLRGRGTVISIQARASN